jgi:hypothetical protein
MNKTQVRKRISEPNHNSATVSCTYHTIVHPWAVMIHLDDASLTNTTMVCSLWLKGMTATTQSFSSRRDSFSSSFFYIFWIWQRFGVRRNRAGISRHGLEMRKTGKKRHSAKTKHVNLSHY